MAKGKRIVVFGCDNSGKTTLCIQLAERLKGGFLPPLGPAPFEEQVARMNTYLVALDETPLIFDRWPIIEEEVCGKILRGVSNFKDKPLLEWSEYLTGIDLFVICDIPLGFVTNWGWREQMAGIKDNIVELRNGYKEVAYMLAEKHPVFFYDWTKGCEQFEELVKILS